MIRSLFRALAVLAGIVWTTVIPATAQKSPSLAADVKQTLIEGPSRLAAARKYDTSLAPAGWPLDVTPAHVSLVRLMRFTWDRTEAGGPMLDPAAPYGKRGLLAQLRQAFLNEKPAALALRHVEMLLVLSKLLRSGTLEPGRYALQAESVAAIRKAFRPKGVPPPTDAELGLGPDGAFEFTAEHRALLRRLSLRWSHDDDNESRLTFGDYPAATVDTKRPYGDFTNYQIEMAQALGLLPDPLPEGSKPTLAPDVVMRLEVLHRQMFGAIQAFALHATLAPGRYD